jgi:hypothetical protein
VKGVRFPIGVLAAATALIVVGAIRWRAAIAPMLTQRVSLGAAPHVSLDAIDSVVAEAADYTVSNDPFRLSNAPATVRFDAKNDHPQFGGAVPLAIARPRLTLKAILGGPPWQAVIDGLPGQPPGTVVRSGATFDKLTARLITRDSVVIQGADTTWVLTFGR